MAMLFGARNRSQKKSNVVKFFVSELCYPQTIEIIKTRAIPLGIDLIIGNHNNVKIDETFFGCIVQYPAKYGSVIDYTEFIELAKSNDLSIIVSADLLSLTLLTPPGEWGADVVVGTTQRFGIPMGYGGPHAAYFATKSKFKRSIPGRIIGVSEDKDGKRALRMALQTREQHIKRENATSNICTAQVLLAVMAGMYAVYHGKNGLRAISKKIHALTAALAEGLTPVSYTHLTLPTILRV